MSPSICIDFGASYTKIAFRSQPDQPTQLLTDESLSLDPEHVCVPTVAAWREADDRWVFGVDAADLKPGNGIRVFSNWKPMLFQPGEENRVIQEIEEDDGNWIGEPLEDADTPHKLARLITLRFFQWLKRELVPDMLGHSIPEEANSRIAIPEFAMYSPEATDLERLITTAGWTSEGILTISEPVSNLIGSLSQGRNRLQPETSDKPLPAIQEMFGESEFLKFVEDDLDEFRDGDQHTVLVLDVGNYTTDFGLITIDLEERGFFPLTECFSMEMGVSKLEQRVKKLLPEATQKAYAQLSVRDRERLRTRVYGEGRDWRMPEGQTIGMGEEGKQIQSTIEGMAGEILVGLRDFLKLQNVTQLGEVILTGGGNNMPALLNRLTSSFAAAGIPALHLPTHTEAPGKTRTIPLQQNIVRGASALGGASILFEM